MEKLENGGEGRKEGKGVSDRCEKIGVVEKQGNNKGYKRSFMKSSQHKSSLQRCFDCEQTKNIPRKSSQQAKCGLTTMKEEKRSIVCRLLFFGIFILNLK